jgi:transcriptional regulator with XRE-family HTH domain
MQSAYSLSKGANTHSQAAILRAKKLGALIRDARLVSGKSLQECARAVGVDIRIFEAYEFGESSPSLPEMELLAFFLNVPLEHFWGRVTLSKSERTEKQFEPKQLVLLRQRMIGVMIRQARIDGGISLENLASQAGLSPETLKEYEYGETSIPVPALESLSSALGRPMREFQDRFGPVGAWSNRQHSVKGFLEMPGDLQSFVTKPINRPYLELAQRLSEMSVDKLRAVAEGLLEITL